MVSLRREGGPSLGLREGPAKPDEGQAQGWLPGTEV